MFKKLFTNQTELSTKQLVAIYAASFVVGSLVAVANYIYAQHQYKKAYEDSIKLRKAIEEHNKKMVALVGKTEEDLRYYPISIML